MFKDVWFLELFEWSVIKSSPQQGLQPILEEKYTLERPPVRHRKHRHFLVFGLWKETRISQENPHTILNMETRLGKLLTWQMATLKLKAMCKSLRWNWNPSRWRKEMFGQRQQLHLAENLHSWKTTPDRGSVIYTDPSSCIHCWGEVLMNKP